MQDIFLKNILVLKKGSRMHSRISKSSIIITFVRSPNGLRTLLLSSIACNAEVRAAADAAGNKFRPSALQAMLDNNNGRF
jgi:hypothetical protein